MKVTELIEYLSSLPTEVEVVYASMMVSGIAPCTSCIYRVTAGTEAPDKTGTALGCGFWSLGVELSVFSRSGIHTYHGEGPIWSISVPTRV